MAHEDTPTLGYVRGSALYVSAVLGPGILTLPALAQHAAGPLFLVSLVFLLLLSVPLAVTFAALGPHGGRAGDLPAYVRAAFGQRAGATVAALFYFGIPPGVAALALFGGSYLQAATGGRHTATVIALLLILLTVLVNLGGLRLAGTVQAVLTGVLVLLLALAIAVASPHFDGSNFTPFAPHGWAALAPAAFLLLWVLTGWEASANLSSALTGPTLRRATATALAIVSAAFLGLSVVMVGALGPAAGTTLVAQLLTLGIGALGTKVAAVLAIVLTAANMNAYIASLAAMGARAMVNRDIPRTGHPLLIPSIVAIGSLVATARLDNAAAVLVGITAASQVPILLLAAAAGVRLLSRGSAVWWCALIASSAVTVLLFAAGHYLLAPLIIGALALLPRRPSVSTPGTDAQCLVR